MLQGKSVDFQGGSRRRLPHPLEAAKTNVSGAHGYSSIPSGSRQVSRSLKRPTYGWHEYYRGALQVWVDGPFQAECLVPLHFSTFHNSLLPSVENISSRGRSDSRKRVGRWRHWSVVMVTSTARNLLPSNLFPREMFCCCTTEGRSVGRAEAERMRTRHCPVLMSSSPPPPPPPPTPPTTSSTPGSPTPSLCNWANRLFSPVRNRGCTRLSQFLAFSATLLATRFLVEPLRYKKKEEEDGLVFSNPFTQPSGEYEDESVTVDGIVVHCVEHRCGGSSDMCCWDEWAAAAAAADWSHHHFNISQQQLCPAYGEWSADASADASVRQSRKRRRIHTLRPLT